MLINHLQKPNGIYVLILCIYYTFRLCCTVLKPFVGELRVMQGVGINSLLARIIFLQNFCTFRCFQKALNEAKPRKCMNTYIYLNLPNKPCGLKNRTFFSPEHFELTVAIR